jgi:hypothetical protein
MLSKTKLFIIINIKLASKGLEIFLQSIIKDDKILVGAIIAED